MHASIINESLRYFTILDACSSGENRQTHTYISMGFFNAWVPHVFLALNYLLNDQMSMEVRGQPSLVVGISRMSPP